MGYWGRARTRDKEDRFKTYAPILKSKKLKEWKEEEHKGEKLLLEMFK